MHLSPQLALFICLGFVAWLFIRDIRERPNVTGALWIPFFWVTISASRFVSQWLNILGLQVGGESVEDGSPIDAIFFFILIALGCYVVYIRRVSISDFVRNNPWVAIYLGYCAVAILWSDYPFIAFKRWIKLFGQPIMVLIVLTEPDPMEAVTRLFKRCTYVIAPISILFIKYFPDLGRYFDQWNGVPLNGGITTNKNILGVDLMILGTFLFWHLLQTLQREKSREKNHEIGLCLILFFMIGWLFHMAHSSTSLATFLLANSIVILLGSRRINKERIGTYLILVVAVYFIGNNVFGLTDLIIGSLGRDPTLTGRTEIWSVLLNWNLNPLLGVGFESFWLGPRALKVNEMVGLGINEAHNGYLETYINLGLLGVLVTAGMLLATFSKIRRQLVENSVFARYRLGYLLAFVIYNWTEAAFRTHVFPFFTFFLISIDYPRPEQVTATQAAETDVSEADLRMVESGSEFGHSQ